MPAQNARPRSLTITVERPHVLNALDRTTAAALEAALRDLEQASELSVVNFMASSRASICPM